MNDSSEVCVAGKKTLYFLRTAAVICVLKE